jgi:ABC-type branched-subunit amino acid transport system permease subunit
MITAVAHSPGRIMDCRDKPGNDRRSISHQKAMSTQLRKAPMLNLLVLQALNGLQLGILLFLVAAGLTLVFGIMDFINLAHGAQYMVGAYLAASFTALTGDFFLGVALALPAALLFGLVLEMLIFRHLYGRSHLDQVLATFGLILILNEGVKIIWGAGPISVPVPDVLSGSVPLIGNLRYPIYRFAIIAAGLAPRSASISWSTTPAPACCCAPAPPTATWSRRWASTSAGCS